MWKEKKPTKQLRLFEKPSEVLDSYDAPDEKVEQLKQPVTLPLGKNICTASFPYKSFDCDIDSCKE